MTRLEVAATVFAGAVIVHNADHVRRGADSLHRDVLVAGILAIVLEVGIVAVVFARKRWAPVTAAAGGVALALGYVVTHFLPEHPLVSDSFPSNHVGAVSWAAASFEVAAAAALALVAVRDLAPAAAPRPWPAVVRQPVVLVLVLSQVVTLAITIGQVA